MLVINQLVEDGGLCIKYTYKNTEKYVLSKLKKGE
jgi:hypothetical protein